MPGVDPVRIDLPQQLEGERIIVRPYREDDWQALWDAVDESREHIGAWLPWVTSYTSRVDAKAHVRRFLARWLLREDLVMGVFDRTSDRLLGGSGLHRIDWNIRRFEIGYWLRKSAEGHGYMTEAVRLLTRCAFESLQAARVEIRMDIDNVRSRAIPERLGYLYAGCLRRSLPNVHGAPRDVDLFALTREDYGRVFQSGAAPA